MEQPLTEWQERVCRLFGVPPELVIPHRYNEATQRDWLVMATEKGPGMPRERTVTIRRDAYMRMLRAELILDALGQAGVDNWEGYGDAIREAHIEAAMEQAEVDTP